MPLDQRSKCLAVLIDAENVSAKIADGLFREIAKIGETSVRRAYGDFSGTRLKGWTDILARHAIAPKHQVTYATGKNASDIALVIDAMDLLHTGRFDGFCLVSSDSDFTRLAERIREQGADVFGFGKQNTPESFQRTCNRFAETDKLIAGLPTPANANQPQPKPAPSLTAPTAIIRRALAQMESQDGWVALSGVRGQIAKLEPGFDFRTYGFKRLSDLVRKTNAFEIESATGGAMKVRLKPAQPKQKRA